MTPFRASRGARLAASILAISAAGCGRRATQADCQLIVDKSVEIQLEATGRKDAPSIEKREEQVRAELKGQIESCEGRRVTDKTMACVRSATTAAELDRCLH